MTSEVDICNIALSQVRAGSINSLSEASTQAQYCRLLYPRLRDQVLEDAPWQFAHKIEPLAELTTTVFNWAHVYQYPSDCLKINRLRINFETVDRSDGLAPRFDNYGLPQPDLNREPEYKVLNVDGNRVIVSNHDELRIDYVVRVENPNLYPTQFIMGLSHLLASHLAIPVVGVGEGRKLRDDSLKLYNAFISAALLSDMNQQYTDTPDSEFVTIRS